MLYEVITIEGSLFVPDKEVEKSSNVGGVCHYTVFCQTLLGDEILEIQLEGGCKLRGKI